MHIAVGMVVQTAVFEAVLYDGLEQHGHNHKILLLHVLVEIHVTVAAHTHHLKVDEVVYVLDFLAQRNHFGLTIDEDVTQHLGELEHTGGGIVVVRIDHGIDVVQRIEKEMRVDLRLQVAQFHVEFLTRQLVGKHFLLVFLALVVENQNDGEDGDEPDEPHDKGDGDVREGENLRKRLFVDEMQPTDIKADGNRRHDGQRQDGKQDEQHDLVPFQEVLDQHLINIGDQQQHHTHEA